jgi:uncharacterized protein
VKVLPKPLSFEWDWGNQNKSLIKHRVTNKEAEEVFGNKPISIFKDLGHSKYEERFVAYGITDSGKKLTIVFTVRGSLIRVISARYQSKRERSIYE